MNYPAEILRLLERNTAAGAYLSQVFTDWLDITHATLAALPAHAAVVATTAATRGTLAEDTPETQTLFARCRSRYPRPEYWQRFQQAFHLLLDSAEGFWDLDSGAGDWDTIGAVYMLTAYKKLSGQYFTPWEIAQLMAQMMIPNGAQEITDRLRQAQRIATERDDANSHLLAATILAGLCVPKEETTDYFVSRILPLIVADFEPITICDPCCGSGVMLLAGARQFPAWAAQAGLVQLHDMDIDQTCVTMARVNMMLYGFNNTALHSALTATPRQLASLPEPFEQAYSLAQEADAAGDTGLVEEIADTLRVQQALFDVAEFAQQVKAPPRSAVQRTKSQTEPIEQFTMWREE